MDKIPVIKTTSPGIVAKTGWWWRKLYRRIKQTTMSKPTAGVSESYFNDLYFHNDDPWNFESSPYEAAKYKATIDVLPQQVYENAFEIGCSIGVLTRMLAPRCKKLLSIDIVDAALARTRQRMADMPQVSVQKMSVPKEFPDQLFDLILFSEVGFYLSKEDLGTLRQQMLLHTNSGAHILLVHWTPAVAHCPLTGDEVHDFFMEITGTGQPLKHLAHQRGETYRLDLFEKS